MEEIWCDDAPLILTMERNLQEYDDLGTLVTRRSVHAVVLRGFHRVAETWSIWNPWYPYYETFPMGGTYVPSTGSTVPFEYCGTSLNWK